jgi:putative SOS response-associated peptidase YedK
LSFLKPTLDVAATFIATTTVGHKTRQIETNPCDPFERPDAMCGRYALTLPPDAVRAVFGYAEQPNFPARYNIAPTQPVPVVVAGAGGRAFSLMRWGFLPGWVKDPKDFPLVINVRSETAREKPSFRNAINRRRALMPADGFYEWHKVGRENRAYLFRRPDRGVFAFAAIWETWSSKDGGEIDTVALLNTHANGLMSAIHPRCPVILEPHLFERWLDPQARPDEIDPLLRPPPDDALEMLRIGSAVNRVSEDGPHVQEPWQPAPVPDEAPVEPAAASPDARAGGKPAARRAGAGRAAPGRSSAASKQGSLF